MNRPDRGPRSKPPVTTALLVVALIGLAAPARADDPGSRARAGSTDASTSRGAAAPERRADPAAPPATTSKPADPGPPAAPAPSPARAPDGGGPRGAEVAACREISAAVESAAMATQTELRAARSQRDSTRAACLDDLLSQLHAASRSARALVEAATEASRGGDATRLAQQRARLEVLADRATRLRASAAACGAPPVARRVVAPSPP